MLRDTTEDWAEVITTSHRVTTECDIWLGGSLLAEKLPVLDGTLTEAADQQIPESVTVGVSCVGPDGTVYTPPAVRPATSDYADSPNVIGSEGHEIRLTYVTERGDGAALRCPLGWYQVQSWSVQDGIITINAVGLLKVISDAQLVAPTSPPPGSTLGTELKRLTAGILPIQVAAIDDRAASSAMAWQSDRLGALYDLADAWPADLRVDNNGVIQVSDAQSFSAEITLTEGLDDTSIVVDSGTSGTRDGISNYVVARGEDSGDPNRQPVQGAAYDNNPAHPTFVGTYGVVVSFYSSPLLTTVEQCEKAAQTVLSRAIASADPIQVAIVPDPRITHGTYVSFTPQGSSSAIEMIVTNVMLPLSATGGQQTLTLGRV